METPRKRQRKYWGSVPHCLSDNKKYIKTDRFFHDANALNKERKHI